MVIILAMVHNKISLLQAYILILMAVGIMDHVIIIPLLLSAAKRDAWVSVLVGLALSPVWVACLAYIIKDMRGTPLKTWLRRHFGKTLSYVLLILISVYVFAMGAISARDTVTWTAASYLPLTPAFVLVFVSMAVTLFAAMAGLRSIAIVAGILLPVVIVLGHFVMTANFRYKDYSLVFPVMEFGMEPVWTGLLYAAGGLLELMGILLFQEHLSKRPGFGSLMLVMVLLAGLIMGPLVGSIAIFGPDEATLQRYPAYEQWRMVQLGEFIAHLDFFSIYQWCSGAFIRVSLSLFLLADLWKPRHRRFWLILMSALMMSAVLLPESDPQFLNFLKDVYFPATVCFFLALTALFVLKIRISKRKRR